jgi:hypothetical protein
VLLIFLVLNQRFLPIADGYRVVQLWLIFSPVTVLTGHLQPPIYIYGQFFKFSNLYRELVNGVDIFTPMPHIDMFTLNRNTRVNGERMGDIIRLTDIREIIELVPRFGTKMDKQLNCDNSVKIPDTFYMNNFADKETFHAILSYQ